MREQRLPRGMWHVAGCRVVRRGSWGGSSVWTVGFRWWWMGTAFVVHVSVAGRSAASVADRLGRKPLWDLASAAGLGCRQLGEWPAHTSLRRLGSSAYLWLPNSCHRVGANSWSVCRLPPGQWLLLSGQSKSQNSGVRGPERGALPPMWPFAWEPRLVRSRSAGARKAAAP